jgi:hypothetical protein
MQLPNGNRRRADQKVKNVIRRPIREPWFFGLARAASVVGCGSRQAAAAPSAFFDWVNDSPGSGNLFTRFNC